MNRVWRWIQSAAWAVCLTTVAVAQVGPSYREGKILGWSTTEQAMVYQTRQHDYGYGVKSGGNVHTIRIRGVLFRMEADGKLYEFTSKKRDFEDGATVQFRLEPTEKPRKLLILRTEKNKTKEKSYTLVGVTSLEPRR